MSDHDGLGKKAIVHVHYFGPMGDWWITEFSEDFATDGIAFGYVRLTGQPENAEWGDIYVPELEELKVTARRGLPLPMYVERDLYWQKETLEACIA